MKIEEAIKRTVTATVVGDDGTSLTLTESEGIVSIRLGDEHPWCVLRTEDFLAYADAVRGQPMQRQKDPGRGRPRGVTSDPRPGTQPERAILEMARGEFDLRTGSNRVQARRLVDRGYFAKTDRGQYVLTLKGQAFARSRTQEAAE